MITVHALSYMFQSRVPGEDARVVVRKIDHGESATSVHDVPVHTLSISLLPPLDISLDLS